MTWKVYSFSKSWWIALLGIVCVAAILLAYWYDNKYTYPRHTAQMGVTWIDEEQYAQSPFLFLVEGWEFYSGKLLFPEEISAHNPDAILYLGQYGGFDLGNRTQQRHGAATYRMTVKTGSGYDDYALELPEIYSRWRIWINGELKQSVGMGDRLSSMPQEWMLTFTAEDSVEIIIQVEDDAGLYSGVVYPPAFGSPQQVGNMLTTRLFLHTAVSAVALFIGLLCLLIGIGTRFHLPYGGLVLLCLCFSIYVGWPIFQAFGLRGFWQVVERLFYYGMFAAVVWLQCRFCGFSSKVQAIACLGGGVICVLILVQPFMTWKLAASYYAFGRMLEIYKWLTAIFLMGSSILAIKRRHTQNNILLAGLFCFGITLIMDGLLPLYEPILLGWPLELAGFLLIVLVAGVLWRDTISSYQESIALREQNALADMQLKARQKHSRTQQEYINRTGRILHESRNNLTVIRHYCLNGESDKTIEYIDNLIDSGKVTSVTYTENSLIDTIISMQYARARNLDIYVELDLVKLPSYLPFDDSHLVSLIMNMLDNAINACEEVKDSQERWLFFSLQLEESTMVIICSNSYNSAIPQRQTEGHGYGMGIMREVTGIYNGSFNISRRPDSFALKCELEFRSTI